MIINIEKVSLRYLTDNVIDEVSLQIEEKDKIGLVGSNGAGKSSLLKIIKGIVSPDTGNIVYKKNINIGYLPQDILEYYDYTIGEYITKDLENKSLDDYRISSILTKFGITNYETKIKHLSGGEKKRVMLAQVLLTPSDILLLDEPTNHLDIDMIYYLEKFLMKFNKAFILITHDRYFLERVVNKIIEIDNGKLFTYGKNYDDYVQLKLQKEEMEAASFKKLQVFLRKELEWIMRGPQGRGTKSKNRIENFHELSNIKAKEKSSLELVYNTSRLGKKIVEISRVSKNINNNQLIQDFSYIINDDDRIGIVGPNGTGKTTLLNIISGISKVDKGKVDIGETVNFGYFKQESVIKDDKIRVIDFISENVIVVNDSNISPTKLLDKFLFTKEQQYTYINKLSGGERRRLLLLKVLIDNPNVLLLDEATNDFDIDTIMVLENFINEFKGPVIMVSHDRYFLDHLCNKIFYINKNGVIDIYNGNYSDNEDDLLSQEPTNNKKDNYRVKEKAIKLTFNERKELDEIENIINELENKVTLLEKEILDNYADYKVIEPLIKEKEELNTILDNKLMRWEYLLTKEETSK